MPATLITRQIVDSFTLRSPLGIRFRDVATGQLIDTGLDVTAFPVGAPYPDALRRSAQTNRSGVWIFSDLSGLRDYEMGVSDLSGSGSPPGSVTYQVDISDDEGRFIPFSFQADAPASGLFQPAVIGSPPWMFSDMPLFSSPQRLPPPACSVVRASVAAGNAATPAAWAIITATISVGSQTISVAGMADAQGQLSLMFPWPELAGPTISSPAGGMVLQAQTWPMQFDAYYDFARAPGATSDLDAALATLQGAPCAMWINSSPATSFSTDTLTYGQELILPTTNLSNALNRTLILTPAGSPP